MTVSQRFDKLLANLTLTDDQRTKGTTTHTGVRSCLNRNYYGHSSGTANSMLVGSWGKSTEVRPPRDIDILLELPYSVYERFEQRPGNKQSQLLQEVKGVLQNTYSSSMMRGDGQVVMVQFTGYAVEVAPSFKLTSGQYWICDTNGGGRYKNTDPVAESNSVKASNDATAGNTRDLIRMMKKWQEFCSVPLKSFWLELLAIDFLQSWGYRGKTSVYYDWMVRDFLQFLISKSGGYAFVPGTFEILWLGSDWKSKAESAYSRALKACQYEADESNANRNVDAWWEWHNIFGGDVPLN